jgi:1-acyl-sn-glycerol-3-phosphate acyltransferase
LAAAMRSLGTIPVDRRSGNGTRLELPGGRWPQDMSLVVFPEGGIAEPGTRRPFHRSAFALAIEYEVPVVPVAIHGSDRALPPRSRLGVRPGNVTIEFLEPLATTGLAVAARRDLCELAERRILAALTPAAGGSNRSSDSF